MLSVGIIWNSSQKYANDIISDLKKSVDVLDFFEVDFGEKYYSFVKSIYEKEQMEDWKIANKILHMQYTDDNKITIIFFDFDENEIRFHPKKNKNVFSKLEDSKMYIREKYKNLVNNYTFDIVFHATDNLEELKNCLEVIREYINQIKLNEDNTIIQGRVLKHKKSLGGKNE